MQIQIQVRRMKQGITIYRVLKENDCILKFDRIV